MLRPRLTYYNIGGGVVAFSTTRHGGVSKDSYGEFNINPYCGDTPEAVSENREALANELGIQPDHIVLPHQTHGTGIYGIVPDFFLLSTEQRRASLDGVDGMLTDMRGVCIGVSTADCIPVLLYDEEHHAVGAVHSGWRGTVKGIVAKAVREMGRQFHTDVHKLRAVVGPGISLENFEVGDEVYDEFASTGFDMSHMARKYEKWHIDLPKCCRAQLIETGVSPRNIQMADVCTYSQVDDYFSARRLGIASGRIFTAIMIR